MTGATPIRADPEEIPMKRSTFFRSVASCLAAAAMLAVVSGCSSTPTAKATVDSMSAFGNETAKVKDSIDSAINALETLVGTQASDIKANFDAYSKAVAALDEQAKVVRTNAMKMQANGDAYFKAWETSKNVNPDRRAELTAAYAKIKEDMALAKDGFVPFLASLKDIESYLSLDLSIKGVNSMTGLVKKAKDNGAEVKSRIDAALLQLNSVRGMLSTSPGK
jgi:hypothetical protein